MRYARWAAVVGFVFISLSRGNAAEVELQGEVELAIHSAFVWRGEVFTEDVIVSPYVAFHAAGLRLSAWGSWELEEADDETDHSRADLMLEYAGMWKGQLFSVGSAAYIYPDNDSARDDTFEVFAGYRVDVPSLPSLTVYYDFGEIEGFYATFSLRHSFPMIKNRLALDLGASIGAGDGEYIAEVFTLAADESRGFDGYAPDDPAFLDLNLTLDFPIELGEHFTLMPGVRHMQVVDSEIEDALDAAGEASDETLWSLRGTYYF